MSEMVFIRALVMRTDDHGSVNHVYYNIPVKASVEGGAAPAEEQHLYHRFHNLNLNHPPGPLPTPSGSLTDPVQYCKLDQHHDVVYRSKSAGKVHLE
jgi:hypothetical protein